MRPRGVHPYGRGALPTDAECLHRARRATIPQLTPWCSHWLATREYSIIKDFIAGGGVVPDNLIVRLSATYPDKPAQLPASLRGIKNITTSNAHTSAPIGFECQSPKHGGSCGPCRACWSDKVISYLMH
jgi:hypothetical protein